MVLHASVFRRCPPILVAVRSVKQLLDLCCRGKHTASTVASKNLTLSFRSNWPQLPCSESRLSRIQYLPAHEKDQVQDIHNWVQIDPEATTRSAPRVTNNWVDRELYCCLSRCRHIWNIKGVNSRNNQAYPICSYWGSRHCCWNWWW